MPSRQDRKTRDQTKPSPNFNWIDSEEPHKGLTTVIRKLVVDQNMRLNENTRFASLYANQDFLQPLRKNPNGARPAMPRQTLNLIKVYGDTLAGKLVQSNSRVNASSIDGDWETFRLARKLHRLLDATFLQGRLFRECSKMVVDGVNVGNGYLYIGEEDGQICYERWYYNEIFVDQLDAMYGNPTMLFRLRYMYPENALALWGKDPVAAEAIRKAPKAQPPNFNWTPYESGMIEIFEAWALELPNRKGRHVLCTAAGVINKNTSYKRTKFPVVNFRVNDLPLGWYGQGFTAHSGGTQVWLNRILDIMARSAHLGMAPFWVVAGNAEISLKQLNNVEGHIVTSNGPEPKWVTNPPFHAAAPQYVELLMSQMGIIYGISDIESSGQMAGNRVDSNPALIQMQDMWMARHTILLKNWSEETFMDIAERTIEVCQDIAERKGSYPVVATQRGRAWAMDWKDFADLKREHYRLVLQPSSGLGLTQAARNKTILDWASAGLLPQEQAQQFVLGTGDVDALAAQIAAFENNADWLCEQLMDGEMPELSELQKPELVLNRIRAAGLTAHEYGAPDKVLLNFEIFAAKVTEKLQQIQTEQMAMMAQQQGLTNGSPAGPLPASPSPPSLGIA